MKFDKKSDKKRIDLCGFLFKFKLMSNFHFFQIPRDILTHKFMLSLIFKHIRNVSHLSNLLLFGLLFQITFTKKSMNSQELDECFDYVKQLILKCGEIVRVGQQNIGKIDTKTIFSDLVTKYDGEVENVLINGIKEKYPKHW